MESLQRLLVLLALNPDPLRYIVAINADNDLSDRLLEWFSDGKRIKTIMDVHKHLNTLKNEELDAIIDTFPPDMASFRIAVKCAELVDAEPVVQDMIGDLVATRVTSRRQEAAAISSLMGTLNIVDKSMISINPSGGVNKGFIVTGADGSVKFVKNFADEGVTRGKIDPNELFVYKVLEHLTLGPKCEFFIRQYSIGHGTAIDGNYIVTNDVRQHATDLFLLDTAENVDMYRSAFYNNKCVNVEFSALAVVNDVLLLGDTFGENGRNYGLLVSTESTKPSYRMLAVDHLPCSNNARFPPHRFSADEQYSPRTSVQKRVDLIHHAVRDKKVALHSRHLEEVPPLELGKNKYPRDSIRSEVLSRVSSMPEAIDEAFNTVMELINTHERSFGDGSRDRVSAYANLARANFAKFTNSF